MKLPDQFVLEMGERHAGMHDLQLFNTAAGSSKSAADAGPEVSLTTVSRPGDPRAGGDRTIRPAGAARPGAQTNGGANAFLKWESSFFFRFDACTVLCMWWHHRTCPSILNKFGIAAVRIAAVRHVASSTVPPLPVRAHIPASDCTLLLRPQWPLRGKGDVILSSASCGAGPKGGAGADGSRRRRACERTGGLRWQLGGRHRAGDHAGAARCSAGLQARVLPLDSFTDLWDIPVRESTVAQ